MNTLKLMIFWWDNFDRFVDNYTGGCSIHNTPGIAFQEETNDTVRRDQTSIARSKRTSLSFSESVPKKIKIDPKKNPATFQNPSSSKTVSTTPSQKLLHLWKCFRKLEERDQTFPRFAGYMIKLLKQKDQNQTVLTYLPPIEFPISDYGTLFEMFHRSEKMAEQANMKYTHITLDCGAAIKAYHILFNNPERFKHIVLHLGDFHAMQAFFGAIGSYVSVSGFEDIILREYSPHRSA